jgi:hypothetical protein
MSLQKRLTKAIRILRKKLYRQPKDERSKKSFWLFRTFLVSRRKTNSANAGFVLPTVVMVGLVVVLLTTAILFRSFERSKNASNVRVNQATLNAVAPALDRARAKLEALFEDPSLPRATPSDNALYDAFKKDKYKLDDEKPLKLAYDIDKAGVITTDSTNLELDETLKTAWKFPVDTDNNGKFDTYTLYGITFRSPTRNSNTGQFNRKRNPLEARTPPMDNDITNQQCANAAGFSTLIGNSSWYKVQGGNLGKSFFVYAVNVPITDITGLDPTKYQTYKGNKGFTALEFQQDRIRVPLAYNAVWYENDLEITPGQPLEINGRIHTNSNLLVGGSGSNGNVSFRQVSSKKSCFFNQENGLISVGGNVGTGSVAESTDQKDVNVDLYKGFGNTPSAAIINGATRSTNSAGGINIGFNDDAYSKRIAKMKEDAINLCPQCKVATTGQTLKTAVNASSYPQAIKDIIKDKVQNTDDGTVAREALKDEIETYLKNRTRKVPFAEVAFGTGNPLAGYSTIDATLEPPQAWREPLDSSNQLNATTISLRFNSNKSLLTATDPNIRAQEGIQSVLGDRIFVGNNLPAFWKQGRTFVGADGQQLISNNGTKIVWDRPNNGTQRWRSTQVQALADLGFSKRSGFWEKKAAESPRNELDNIGGLRIVTGAGIYVDDPAPTPASTPTTPTVDAVYHRVGSNRRSFLPAPPPLPTTPATPANAIPVWPDTMPMSSPNPAVNLKGDLLMRATAVYYYNAGASSSTQAEHTDREPIACISSYYDPSVKSFVDANNNGVFDSGETKIDSGNNQSNLPLHNAAIQGGRSNNGVVYNFPGRANFAALRTTLDRQSRLVFPNGRQVNKSLADALSKISAGSNVPVGNTTNLELADYSAIDTALCAISILNNPTGFTTPTNQPPHGAIKEASFLDAREIKQISASAAPTTDYDLDLEQRQPLEVRVTDIDLGVLAKTLMPNSEYLLPQSGIIYATRDDALGDASDGNPLLSPTDFKLDPTRRTNGIRLINGETLARNPSVRRNAFNAMEKGLILVTDLPAYIRGKFNIHRTSTTSITEIEEFSDTTVSFYDRRVPNTDFACRPGRTGCPTTAGDYWRPATVIADAMTLLSDTFEDGARNQGDFDLNDNTGLPVAGNVTLPATGSSLASMNIKAPTNSPQGIINRLKQGFWQNSFVNNYDWWQTGGATSTLIPKAPVAGTPYYLGSYTLNGVTPVQRRVNQFPLYVMEICRKDLVSECTANDWVVDFDSNGNGTLEPAERDIRANQLSTVINATNGNLNDWNAVVQGKSIRQRLGAGDTGTLPLDPNDRRYPRRVAFARDPSNNLIPTAPGIYQPLGVGCPLTGCTYKGTAAVGTNYGILGNSALFFRTTNFAGNNPTANPDNQANQSLLYYPPIDANNDGIPDPDGQPLLVPILQIHDVESNAGPALRQTTQTQAGFRNSWLQKAMSTNTNPNPSNTFNATFVVGNSPSRATEVSAGLQNLVRFLENWSDGRTAKISGGFIQAFRSSYATAPLSPLFRSRSTSTSTANTLTNLSTFNLAYDNYPTQDGNGLLPFYSAPIRNWGFDVGLLSEQPDLFAQRFTSPSVGRPNEFFREIGRDDPWVTTLLCAGQKASSTATNYLPALPNESRPANCPTVPND